jgi:exosortase E/protease (VPEID-CTERM system)
MTTPTQVLGVPRVGWWSLAALLIEYVVLSQLHDVSSLAGHARPWSWLGELGDGAALVFILAAVAAALSQRTRSLLSADPTQPSARRAKVHWLEFGLGVVCFSGVLWLSSRVLTPNAPSALEFAAWASFVLSWMVCRTHWAWPAGGVRGLWRARPIWAPIAAIAALSAAAGLGARALWSLQSDVVLEWVLSLLRAVGESPERGEGNEIWLGDFGVDVAPICSGYEGIGLMVAFVGGYLVVMRKELEPRLAWPFLPLAVVVVWLANVGRLAALTWIGARVSRDWAAGAFHSKAGWLLFCAIALSMVWLVQRIAGRAGLPDGASPSTLRVPQDAATSEGSPAARGAPADSSDLAADTPLGRATTYYLAPLVATTGVALITGVFFEPLDRLYGLRVVATLVALVACGYRFRSLFEGVSRYSVGAGLLVFGLWVALRTEPAAETVNQFGEQLAALSPTERSAWLVLRVLGTTLTIPICEELAFRGFLLRRLAKKDFVALNYQRVPWWALAVSSLLFAVLHSSWLAGVVAGAVYGGLVRWRGRLAEATIAHMLTNLCLAVLALSTQSIPYWH